MSFLDRRRGTDEVTAYLLLLGLGGTALLDELFVRCHTDKIRMNMNFKFLLLLNHNHSQPYQYRLIYENLKRKRRNKNRNLIVLADIACPFKLLIVLSCCNCENEYTVRL